MKARRPSIHTRLRLGLTVIIALVMFSSTATVMLFNSALVLAYSRVGENSSDHSNLPKSKERSSPSVSSLSSLQSNEPAPTPTAPSPISHDGGVGDVTIQAPLQIPRTLQSNDLVNSLAFYEVTFITSTTGAIDRIRMDFPAGTNIAAAGVIERVGIGGGTLLKSGSSITYDVTSPINIPAGTFIRLEIFGIKNPNTTSSTFTATITTRDSGGNLIDGPSQTNVYTIKEIGTDDIAFGAVTTPKIADGAITSTKPAESFMKRVTVFDNDAGHAVGWDPNGATVSFSISDPDASGFNTAYVGVTVLGGVCFTVDQFPAGTFQIGCSSPPTDGAVLNYLLVNLPANFV